MHRYPPRRLIKPSPRVLRSTELRISSPGLRITFILEGPSSFRLRKALALAIFGDLDARLQVLGNSWIRHHFESRRPSHADPSLDEAPFSLLQAPTIATPLGRLGFIVRAKRLTLGLTQDELARLARLRRTHLSRVERGFHLPHEDTLLALERALGMTLPRPDPATARSVTRRRRIQTNPTQKNVAEAPASAVSITVASNNPTLGDAVENSGQGDPRGEDPLAPLGSRLA